MPCCPPLQSVIPGRLNHLVADDSRYDQFAEVEKLPCSANVEHSKLAINNFKNLKLI